MSLYGEPTVYISSAKGSLQYKLPYLRWAQMAAFQLAAKLVINNVTDVTDLGLDPKIWWTMVLRRRIHSRGPLADRAVVAHVCMFG